MKLYLPILLIAICLINYTKCNSYSLSLKSHLEMMTKMKAKSRAFLEKLYITANSVDEKPNDKLNFIEKSFLEKNSIESKAQQEPGHRNDPVFIKHFSKIPKHRIKHRNITQYEYREYRNITNTIIKLAKDYPDLVKLTTAQEEFNLPNPGGSCVGQK